MTKKTSDSPLELVTALMQERTKFETWLAALEERRSSTPQNVYDRVRADYERRLNGVMEELRSHATELELQAEQYTGRLAELAEQEQTRRDARAEAELRAHVGELSPEDWESTAKEADDALAAIAAEQAIVGADLNRVHELLAAATAAPAAPAAGSGAQAARPAAAPPPRQSPVPAQPAQSSSAKAGEPSSFDELAFLKSVVSPLEAAPPIKSGASAPLPPRPTGPQIAQAQTDVLAESLSARPRRGSQDHTFVREDAPDAAADLQGRAQEPLDVADRPLGAGGAGSQSAMLRPSGAVEQPKTLKCVECGAMNYPTEWYCERCGAELASL